jgi:3-oxoacyl-(acyl-carrier-protein) synthase
MIRCYLEAIGLAAPGLTSWHHARSVLRGETAYAPAADAPYAPALLPPNERRRATAAVRQAFRAGEDALSAGTIDVTQLASVFASSDADMAVLNRMCAALAEPTRIVSPTDFHNSVHNAASGYFTIAIKSMAPTTTIAAYDASFAVGLLEAATLAAVEQRNVLLVAYDVVAPEPLFAARPLEASGSVALVLTPQTTSHTLKALQVELGVEPISRCARAELEPLRTACPALTGLPLLEWLAAERSGLIVVPYACGRSLAVELQ